MAQHRGDYRRFGQHRQAKPAGQTHADDAHAGSTASLVLSRCQRPEPGRDGALPPGGEQREFLGDTDMESGLSHGLFRCISSGYSKEVWHGHAHPAVNDGPGEVRNGRGDARNFGDHDDRWAVAKSVNIVNDTTVGEWQASKIGEGIGHCPTIEAGDGRKPPNFAAKGGILESVMSFAVRTVRLSKYHGLGNDFLVLVVRDGADAPTDEEHAALAVASCDRHRGVGADGLLICASSPTSEADLVMRLRNADGSLAEMSGNGIRCFVHAALDAGMVSAGVVEVATDSGLRVLKVSAPVDGVAQVEVSMGEVVLDAVPIPDAVRAVLAGRRATTVTVGNPHIVIDADPSSVDLVNFGPSVENWYLGSELRGINVEVIARSADPDDAIDMAVWERGVGITQACGTGAVASAAVASAWGIGSTPMVVRQPGGDATVAMKGTEATLIGPSQFVCVADFAWPLPISQEG